MQNIFSQVAKADFKAKPSLGWYGFYSHLTLQPKTSYKQNLPVELG